MQWGRFHFTKEKSAIMTDLLLYRDRSYLLLPSEGDENRFLVHSHDSGVHFFIGSSSLENYNMMEKFFTRIYKCYIREEEPEIIDSGLSVALVNKRQLRKIGFNYFPGFVKNMIYLPSSVPNLSMQYEVIIRSSQSLRKERLYNFASHLKMDYDGGSPGRLKGHIRNEVMRLRKEKKWRLKMKNGGKIRFRKDLLREPGFLCNFVRVPEDEGRQLS